MTKSDLIEAVANGLKLPKGKAELIINSIFASMETALKTGERIEIRGFGSFEVRNYKSYEGRNPRTGAPVKVAPKRLPFFKVGKELRERVNTAYLRQLAQAESTPLRPAPSPPPADGSSATASPGAPGTGPSGTPGPA
jgi:integration host factor subunit beta